MAVPARTKPRGRFRGVPPDKELSSGPVNRTGTVALLLAALWVAVGARAEPADMDAGSAPEVPNAPGLPATSLARSDPEADALAFAGDGAWAESGADVEDADAATEAGERALATDDASAPGEEPTLPESTAAESALEPAAVLPPAEPEPAILPIVAERTQTATETLPPIRREDRSAVVIGTLLGLLALIALAYLGGHPRVQELERRLGVSQVITAGFPFVLLGLVARHPRVGLLSDALLSDLSPLLRIGLGCIGFTAGFRFSAQFRAGAAPEAIRLTTWVTAVPFTLVASVSGAALLTMSGELGGAALRDPVFIRDALILGTAGAMTAKTSGELFGADDVARLLGRVLRLEELAGIIGLAVVASYFRPQVGVSWQLPGTAWLLLTIGLGATLGLIAYLVFKRPQQGPEFVVLTLGSIGFGAGMAGYLRLSPVVVAFIAGTCVALLPSQHKDRIRTALRRLERPIYLLSLIVIGALWQVDDWRGWALVPVFTGARFLGKWLGALGGERYSGATLSAEERRALAVSPMGALAIAIVVNAQLLYPGGSISPIVAAVIGGAILTEITVQLASRRSPTGRGPTTADAGQAEPSP